MLFVELEVMQRISHVWICKKPASYVTVRNMLTNDSVASVVYVWVWMRYESETNDDDWDESLWMILNFDQP